MWGVPDFSYVMLDFLGESVVVVRVLCPRRIAHWMPVLTAYILWLGKGWIVHAAITRRLPYWATGTSTRAGTSCADLQLMGSSVADCQALT